MTVEELRGLLDYDPDRGVFTWKGKGCKRMMPGDRAGTATCRGYRQITIDRRIYLEHRLAWFHTHGEWPGNIDHKNGDPADNRLCNLRAATGAQNNANRRFVTNQTGLKGVRFRAITGKWEAAIKVNRRTLHIGTFSRPEDAHAAYCEAAQRHYGEYARAG